MARFNREELREYVQVHRGLHEVSPELISSNHTGVHWTADRGVASDFANYGVYMEANDADNFMSAYSAEDSHGTVLTGKVHVSDVIAPHDPNYNLLRQKLGIFYPGHREKELTLRPDATVKDVAAHHYENGKLVKSVFLGDRTTYPHSYVKGLI